MVARARWQGLVVSIALGAACGGAAAQSNLLFLKSSPISRFNDEDVRLMTEAGVAVLESDDERAARDWRNEKTRHSGRVSVLQRFEFQSRPCRRLRVDTRAAGMQGTAQLSACKDGSGTWVIEPRARPAVR